MPRIKLRLERGGPPDTGDCSIPLTVKLASLSLYQSISHHAKWFLIGLGLFLFFPAAQAGGPMGVDGGVVVSGSTVNLTPALASNYVAGKTGWIRVNMILPSGSTGWGSKELGYYDQAINNAKAAGLQVLILMNAQGFYNNGTLSSENANDYENTGGNGDNSYIDTWVTNVVTPIVQRFHDRVKIYEIWNEPSTWGTSNSPTSFSGGTWLYPSCYSWMLARSWIAAHKTLGFADVKIITSDVGQHYFPSLPMTNGYATYLTNLYTLGTNPTVGSFSSVRSAYGAYPIDGLGQHLYIDYNTTTTTAKFQSFLNVLRFAFTNYEGAATTKKTYLTEFGWNTTYVSQSAQDANLVAAFTAIEAPNSFVAMAIWFTWEDGGAGNFGVLTSSGQPKTAYPDYQFWEQYEGYYTNGALETNIANYFKQRGQAVMGDAFDNGNSAFVHTLAGGNAVAQAQDFSGGSHQNVTIFDSNAGSSPPWYLYPVCVPFDNTNFDTQYGGSHDMDVQTPLGTPVTSLVSGTVSSVTQPTWGWQIGIQLDTAIGTAPYLAYLHLGAVKPGLAVGQRVSVGEIIAYSGGANSSAELGSNTNTPFGPQFIDDPSQSSQPQTGIALMRGPEYGVGAGWTPLPDPTLDPTPTLNQAVSNYLAGSNTFEVNDLHGLWTYYFSNGGMTAFGAPSGNEYLTAMGSRQDFAFASLLWNSSTGQVTNAVVGASGCFAVAKAPSKIRAGTATLNGMVTPNGAPTSAWFEWGSNSIYGQRTVVTNLGGTSQVLLVSAPISNLTSSALYHYRVVASNALGGVTGPDQVFTTGGRVEAWGDDSYGQTNIPAGLTNAVAAAAGYYHGSALRNDGTVAAWGENSSGQTNVPNTVTNAIAIAAGVNHSVALRADGTVVAWGYNGSGQTNIPMGLSNVIAIAAGGYHNLALQANGVVVAWGNNNFGETNVPAGLINIVDVTAGLYHSVALRADGTVVAWGDNANGQSNVPNGLTNVVRVLAGEYRTLAMKADGTVVIWGSNFAGEGTVPAGISNTLSIACGGTFNLAALATGASLGWGDDSAGQTDLPLGLTNVSQFSAGLQFGLAIGDRAPTANPETAVGFVNHDLIIGLTGNDPDGLPVSYSVAALPAAGTLYQCSAGARGAPITASNSPVNNSLGQVIFAPTPGGVGSPYAAFSFVAGDAQYTSTPATVTLNFRLPSAPQITSNAWTPQIGGTGQFSLYFTGEAGATYRVWVSSDLQNWTDLGQAMEVSPGQYQFLANTTNTTEQFYRATAP
jgi:hypothetical protein